MSRAHTKFQPKLSARAAGAVLEGNLARDSRAMGVSLLAVRSTAYHCRPHAQRAAGVRPERHFFPTREEAENKRYRPLPALAAQMNAGRWLGATRSKQLAESSEGEFV